MGDRRWMVANGLGLAVAITGLAWLATHVIDKGKSTSPPLPALSPLRDKNDVVGEWNRVEFPDAVIPVNWRKFSDKGTFEVRYGDLVHQGSYAFAEDGVLETLEGHDGTLIRWQVGFAGAKLVLIHQKHGWVEQYVRVPLGMLD